MADELSLDQFIQTFGMTPEEYEQKNPDKVKPVSGDVPFSGLADILPGVVKHYQNATAGVAALPSSVPGVIDLVRLGVPALVKGIAAGNPDKGTFENIGDAFTNEVMPPETMAQLVDVQQNAVKQFREQNPTATDADVGKFLEWYSDSDEFYQNVVDKLPLGLSIANKGQWAANEMAGLDTRPDQMSLQDEVTQILSQAFVGLPQSTVASVVRPIVGRVGRNLAARTAGRVAEVLTPATLPLTPGNIALNAGAGLAVNEAVRGVQGEDTFINYQSLYNPDDIPKEDALAAATGMSAGILFGLPGIRRAGKEAAEAAATRIGQSAGPTLAEQSDELTPQLSRVTGLVDQNAPVKKAAQLYKDPTDTETVPQLDAVMSSASTVNRVEAENNALNYGILEGMPNTVPYADVRRAINQMPPEAQDMLDKYVYAVQRKQDSAIYEANLVKQLRSAQGDMRAAELSGDKRSLNAAQKKVVELQQKYTALQQDDPSSRSSMQNWTRSDVDAYIAAGEANPQIKQVADAMRKVSGDLVDYMHKNGIIDAAEAARRKGSRELYVPLQERAHPDARGAKRAALLFKDKFKARDTEGGFFINTAGRNVTGEGAAVNNPQTSWIAMQSAIMDAVRSVSANNARREVIDRLDALPGARDNLLRPYTFKTGDGRTSTSISVDQYNLLHPRGIPKEDEYIKVFRNGNVEFWQFGDKSITRSLQFAPQAAIPIMNATRQIWQQMTTGLAAPWFLPRAFLWDVPLAQTTKQAGRSLGLVDTFARRLLAGTSLEKPAGDVLDRVFDPTAFASAGLAIPYQLGLRAARAVGIKVAQDLASNSGVFAAIANSGPQGRAFVEGVGTYMANAFDRSALGVMSRNMSTSLSHLNEISRIGDDYAKASVGKTGPVKALFDMYKAAVDSVHMATRTAFFASNYSRLEAKYQGNIPAGELRKLVQETRNLTGDMTRQSNSPLVQKLTSVIPYSNAAIQGTRHLLSAAVPNSVAKGVNTVGGNLLTDRNTRFWSQFISGMVLPSIAAYSVLSNWEGAEDYWFNRVPKWQQMTGIPFPNADTLLEAVQTGQIPKFSPDKLNILPISPEFVMVLEPVMSGLRAIGLIGEPARRVPGQFSTQVKDVVDQITGFATPPLLQAIFAANGTRLDLHGAAMGEGMTQDIQNVPHGGANADMMTMNSDIPATVYNVIGAIGSSAAQIAMQSLNVFDISQEKGASFLDALGEAVDTASFEVKRRMPQIDVPVVFDARQRLYSFTPESEYVHKTEKLLEPIIGSGRQLSVERDANDRETRQLGMGLVTAAKLNDPVLKGLSQSVWDRLMKNGKYKQASEAYTEIRADLAALEASRYKVPDDKYNDFRNKMVKQQQELVRVQSQELQKLETEIQQALGRRFISRYGVPFTYENLSNLVRQNVAGQ